LASESGLSGNNNVFYLLLFMVALQQIKILLSSRLASFIIIIISIAGRVVQKLHFTGVRDDKAFQLQATKNLVAGHGITIHEVFSNDLAQASYEPLIKWPPGHSIFFAPFYSVGQQGFLWGSFWLDILFAVLFVWLGRKILLLLEVPIYAINIYTFVTGFLIFEFSLDTTTDIGSLVFYQAGIYFSLTLAKRPGKSYRTSILIGLLFFAGGLLRYQFIPVSFVIPAYFIASGIINRDKRFTGHGSCMFLTAAIMVATLLILQQLNAGSAAYVMPTQAGFYPDQLLRLYPFVFASLANLELLFVQVEKLSGVSYANISIYIGYIHLVVFVIAIAWFVRWCWEKKMIQPTLTEHYFYMGVFSSLAAIGTLAVLSLQNAVLIEPLINWTFLDEARYYSIPIFFTQQLLFILTGKYWQTMKRAARVLLASCMVSLLLFTLHSVYYTVQHAPVNGRTFFRSKNDFSTMEYARNLLHQLIAGNPGKNIVCSSSTPMFNNFGALWENVPALYDYEKLNSLQLKASRETIVFVAVWERDSYRLTGFLNYTGKQLIGSINDYRFYTLHVKPGSP
jgi:hypothetical protein